MPSSPVGIISVQEILRTCPQLMVEGCALRLLAEVIAILFEADPLKRGVLKFPPRLQQDALVRRDKGASQSPHDHGGAVRTRPRGGARCWHITGLQRSHRGQWTLQQIQGLGSGASENENRHGNPLSSKG